MKSPAGSDADSTAAALLAEFADRTGVGSDGPKRYLWTDAFAVCTCLGLARTLNDDRFARIALTLVADVHRVLGCFRPDDARRGWVSGLDQDAGAEHPTVGGLRIGKPLPERRPGEPLDEELEWERDGQYFHYLTKWMHALDRVARARGDARASLWARELAAAAHAAFVRPSERSGELRMIWKASTDLSRPLVPSMGQHDALDGLVACVQLETTAAELGEARAGPDLAPAIRDFGELCARIELCTADPLGLGGILCDALFAARLEAHPAFAGGALLGRLLAAADSGLAQYAHAGEWRRPAAQRLAFRELGLALGLAAVARLERDVAARRVRAGPEERAHLESLRAYRPLGAGLVATWVDPAHRSLLARGRHRDIDEVMLAAALAPEGFLGGDT